MKLYWRYKKGDRWTWKAAIRHRAGDYMKLGKRIYAVAAMEEEE
jgi:hypothetical protein